MSETTLLTTETQNDYTVWQRDDFFFIEVPGTSTLEHEQAQLKTAFVEAVVRWVKEDIEAGMLVVENGEIKLADESI